MGIVNPVKLPTATLSVLMFIGMITPAELPTATLSALLISVIFFNISKYFITFSRKSDLRYSKLIFGVNMSRFLDTDIEIEEECDQIHETTNNNPKKLIFDNLILIFDSLS